MNENKFMSAKETCDYLGLSKSWLTKLTMQRKIPFYKPGGKKMYFAKNELDEWIMRGRIAADNETKDASND